MRLTYCPVFCCKSIELELKEVFTRSQMIYNGLSTTSGGSLLESGGMFYLNAMQGEDTLSLSKSAVITLPNKNQLYTGQYFDGKFSKEGIDWQLVEYDVDTTITTAWIIPLSYGADSVYYLNYRVINQDTIPLFDSTYLSYNNVDYTVSEVPVLMPNVLYLGIQHLGWINCDEFYKLKDPTSLTINNDDNLNAWGYMVFEDINSVMSVYLKDGSSDVSPLPRGEYIQLLLWNKIGDEYKMYNERVRLGKTESIEVEFKSATLKSIKKAIDELDQL